MASRTCKALALDTALIPETFCHSRENNKQQQQQQHNNNNNNNNNNNSYLCPFPEFEDVAAQFVRNLEEIYQPKEECNRMEWNRVR